MLLVRLSPVKTCTSSRKIKIHRYVHEHWLLPHYPRLLCVEHNALLLIWLHSMYGTSRNNDFSSHFIYVTPQPGVMAVFAPPDFMGGTSHLIFHSDVL
jgi:Highly conserved protein containing a thioredoxin domain